MAPPIRNLLGVPFPYFEILARATNHIDSSGRSTVYWFCLCTCGKVFEAATGDLVRGSYQSCGCKQRELLSASNRIDGRKKHSLYGVWRQMIQRCTNPSTLRYADYGGRGITVNPEWLDFWAFVRDMAPRPTPKHKLERIDNNGPYTKMNCCWATQTTQARNTRKNVYLTFDGQTHCVAEWAEIKGWPVHTIWTRLRYKWPIEKVLMAPRRKWPSQSG